MSVLLAAAAALLFALGTYLVLQRKLSRIIIGIGLMSHGANILFILAGRRGAPPIIGENAPDGYSDPLPQALTLTAIVITFGVTAFLLALAYRSWVLTDDDEVEHDVGDLDIRLGRMPKSEDLEDLEAEQQTAAQSLSPPAGLAEERVRPSSDGPRRADGVGPEETRGGSR